jgi:hypothetical protein
MSRAININASEQDVIAQSKAHGISVSAIEELPSGGTRVVLTSMADATAMRLVFATRLIDGPVDRTPFRLGIGAL